MRDGVRAGAPVLPRVAGSLGSLGESAGARRRVLALAGGALAGFALPPLHLIPLAFAGFCLLALLIDGAASRRAAFADGWFFGAGFFLVGLYWLGLPVVIDVRDDTAKDLILAGGLGGTALLAFALSSLAALRFGSPARPWRTVLRHGAAWVLAALVWVAVAILFLPGQFAWMVPFAVFGTAAGLALFPALATLATKSAGLRGVRGIVILAIAWTAAEWLRGHVLTGFPWNLAATIWTPVPAVNQAAAWVGAYGLSFLFVLVAGLPVAALIAPTRLGRVGGPVCAAVLLAALWAAGHARMPAGAAPVLEGVTLRLVQPAIPQRLKWDSGMAADNLALHVALSGSAAAEGITHIVWPETAAGFFLSTDSPDPAQRRRIRAFRERLAEIVPRGGALIAGAVRHSVDGPRYWNSVQALNDAGDVVAGYDKHHLVPFGEYVPARPVLSALGIERLAQGRQDFSAGPGPRTLRVAGLPSFSPLICYEAIFPGAVAVPGSRPAWLLNLTNDAWFGASAGPYQHFASARMRAIEEGLPLVRVANTGISGVVDPYGRVVDRLGLDRRGAIDVRLPRALPATPYARWGDWTAAILLLACAGLAAAGGLVFRPRSVSTNER